ncbi:hypothetical protein [Nonomuraea sp. NPDC049695]|uniref:hypothetical protein n=1 Tax=Nonomuraea sp. NPDC049695 TaxID=3154734 RepID=UPI0034304369
MRRLEGETLGVGPDAVSRSQQTRARASSRWRAAVGPSVVGVTAPAVAPTQVAVAL